MLTMFLGLCQILHILCLYCHNLMKCQFLWISCCSVFLLTFDTFPLNTWKNIEFPIFPFEFDIFQIQRQIEKNVLTLASSNLPCLNLTEISVLIFSSIIMLSWNFICITFHCMSNYHYEIVQYFKHFYHCMSFIKRVLTFHLCPCYNYSKTSILRPLDITHTPV